MNKVLLLLFSSIHFLCKNMKLKAFPNSTHFLLYYSPSIQILPCKMVFCLLLFYRSEEEDFENFMRAFFGQFNPPREERNQGSNKQPKKRKRKKR